MTVQEFSNQFDILYNAIATQSAPGIDSYEKSVYLTKAQLEIIKNYYDPASNRKQKGFEGSEKRRVDLKNLIKNHKSEEYLVYPEAISNDSKFFDLPEDLFLIINEKVKGIKNGCVKENINIKPMTHDEFNIQIKNPFKKYNDNLIWRMDFSRLNEQNVVELITDYDTLEYQLRYIKYPKPIIIEDLNTSFPGEGLTINGETSPQTCELNISIHEEILDRAVELCLRDYKPQNLESKIQLDLRNE